MKFLHIADLHIGRRLNGLSLAEDQRHILSELLEMAAGCDAVLIAGDLYNRAQPGGEAIRMAGDFLAALAEMAKPVFLIAGNHDGGELVSYCGEILNRSDIHAAGVYEGRLERHVLRDAYGEVHVYLLPFVKPIHVRSALRDHLDIASIETYADAVRAVLSAVSLDAEARNVLVAHQYVSGAEVSDSEERAIGGLDQVPAELFDRFDYVALGHLHSPQKLAEGRVCYSGSPLKYSLSEERQKKGALLVELREKGVMDVAVQPLHPLRDVRTATGKLMEIIRPDCASDDFVAAVVTDELPPPDPLGALRTVYPNLISMRIQNSRTNVEMPVEALEVAEQKDPLEHFVDFYTRQNNQVPPDARRMAIMKEIIEQVREKGYAAD